MKRTSGFYMRNNKISQKLSQNDSTASSGLYEDRQSLYKSVRQTYVYQNKPKYPDNLSGQFQSVQKKKPRSIWEMKNHTYELEWPKKQERKVNPSVSSFSQNSNRVNNRSFILENNPEHNLNLTTR